MTKVNHQFNNKEIKSQIMKSNLVNSFLTQITWVLNQQFVINLLCNSNEQFLNCKKKVQMQSGLQESSSPLKQTKKKLYI